MSAIRQDTEHKDGFLFLGNQPALDFLNTRPVKDGVSMELLKDFTVLLRWFQAAGLLSSLRAANLEEKWGNSTQARQLVENVRELREKLRQQVLAWEHGGIVHPSFVGELNKLMADHPMLLRLHANKKRLATEIYFVPQRPEDLFAPLAHSAATLFADIDRKRVRKCDECVLHFHDTSKKGTRRWCSMQLCGNRMKVAAYAARHRRQP